MDFGGDVMGLFEIGNEYARESSWKDFALTKLCLFSMGVAAGTLVPDRYRKAAVGAASVGFLVSYVPLMAKVVRIAVKGNDRGKQQEL